MEKQTRMGEQTNVDTRGSEPCAPTAIDLNEFRRAVHAVIGKWKIEILWLLLAGPRRFGELRRALPGITQHMLTAQLRALEADRLISRTVYSEMPPHVGYALTPKAYALKPTFMALLEWSHEVKHGTPRDH